MKCETVRTKLSVYMDNELDAELHARVAQHLGRCRECREELEQFKGIDTLLRNQPRCDMAPDFPGTMLSRVRERAGTEREGHFFGRAWKRLLEYSAGFMELLEPQTRPHSRSLDEFNDIPASFIGHAYFKILG